MNNEPVRPLNAQHTDTLSDVHEARVEPLVLQKALDIHANIRGHCATDR